LLVRGWNLYDFNQMLEFMGGKISPDKQSSFERNRNLFYVACSRRSNGLPCFSHSKLSATALATLTKLFGADAVHALPA